MPVKFEERIKGRCFNAILTELWSEMKRKNDIKWETKRRKHYERNEYWREVERMGNNIGSVAHQFVERDRQVQIKRKCTKLRDQPLNIKI